MHWVATFLDRLGVGRRETEPAILFTGQTRGGFEPAAAVIDRLCDAGQRLVVSLASADPEVRLWLSKRFGAAHVRPLPVDAPGLVALWLSAGRVRTVVLLADGARLGRCFAAALDRRATPLVLFGETADGGAAPVAEMIVDADARRDPAALADRLLPLVGRERSWEARSDRRLRRCFATVLVRAMNNPGWRSILGPFIERFDTTDALNTRLGNPGTILCLGNGPSSEGPAVAALAHDALFRVNHSWQDRGFLAMPDVVFTGERATMRRIDGAILGVRTASAEKSLLMTRALRPFRGALRYFDAEAILGRAVDGHGDGQRPTNGAIMVAVAAALAPARLAIAGIDLFRHPDGGYPGDRGAANAYTPAHSEDTDLAMIFAALDAYEGELVILSDPLKAAWDTRQKGALP